MNNYNTDVFFEKNTIQTSGIDQSVVFTPFYGSILGVYQEKFGSEINKFYFHSFNVESGIVMRFFRDKEGDKTQIIFNQFDLFAPTIDLLDSTLDNVIDFPNSDDVEISVFFEDILNSVKLEPGKWNSNINEDVALVTEFPLLSAYIEALS